MDHPDDLNENDWPLQNPPVRRAIRFGSGIVPYLAWLVPVLDRLLVSRRDTVTPALMTLRNDVRSDLRKDLNHHITALQATQVDVSPAIEEQQRRLEKLEEFAGELNHSLINLAEDQLDLADQVRLMAGWVRNGAIGALLLLLLMFILKLVEAFHGMGH